MPERIRDRPLAKKILVAQLAEPCREAVAAKECSQPSSPLRENVFLECVAVAEL
jgi:hypothetical protein